VTSRTERRRQFELQRDALLKAIGFSAGEQQLRDRARTLARHGNTDQQIALELGQRVETVRRWLSP